MTPEERIDRLAAAIEEVANMAHPQIMQLTEIQLTAQKQMGMLAEQMVKIQDQQIVILQRQAEQDQRFEVLLGEVRYLTRQVNEARQVNGDGSWPDIEN
jgi:hypothetical protein